MAMKSKPAASPAASACGGGAGAIGIAGVVVQVAQVSKHGRLSLGLEGPDIVRAQGFPAQSATVALTVTV